MWWFGRWWFVKDDERGGEAMKTFVCWLGLIGLGVFTGALTSPMRLKYEFWVYNILRRIFHISGDHYSNGAGIDS